MINSGALTPADFDRLWGYVSRGSRRTPTPRIRQTINWDLMNEHQIAWGYDGNIDSIVLSASEMLRAQHVGAITVISQDSQ